MTDWKTQEFAASEFVNMAARSYLTGLSSPQNLIKPTHWPSGPTVVDFMVYNGVGAIDGAQLVLSNPGSGDATVRSFSVRGFVHVP